jgi:Family of unknown function (DUF6282)
MSYEEIDLTGTIDLHLHSAPDIRPRKLDDFGVAREAAARGMQAVMLKSHFTLTADRAYLVEQVVPGIKVFGGLALNHAVGGINPVAVETALRMGAAEIWMPTVSSIAQTEDIVGPGISIYENGRVSEPVLDVLRLIAEHNAILGTGHLPTEEIVALVPVARELGVRKILISHPEHPPVEMPPLVQEELRDRYQVLFERCLITTTYAGGNLLFAGLADVIRRVGSESTVIATDLGQASNPTPVEGLAAFIAFLSAEGFDKASIARMSRQNPAELLELS